MIKLKILNIHQLTLLQTLNFMHPVKNSTIPSVFHQIFQVIDHIYPTRNCQNNFVQSLIKYKQTKNDAISSRGPNLRTTLLTENLKSLHLRHFEHLRESNNFFFSLENEIFYF